MIGARAGVDGRVAHMKHTITALAVTVLVLAGCGTTHEGAAPTERVEVVSTTPLPPMPLGLRQTGMKLDVLIHILPDGTVENARILGSDGDREWDSLAVQSMKQWRFAPFRRDGVAVDLWFRQVVVVQSREPMVMTIGELVCSSLREADSLHALLEGGADLDSLFRRSIGTHDIGRYPKHVREALGGLDSGGYTSPLRRGEEYVIYKRFNEGTF